MRLFGGQFFLFAFGAEQFQGALGFFVCLRDLFLHLLSGFLELRRNQARADPAREEWLPRAIALERRMIGHIGFHGPPGVNGPQKPGALEVGYTVFEPFRRQGYATEAVVGILRWAQAEHGVRHFVASVGPWNEPSLALVRRLGFRQTGTQWDDEDGEELVFELEVEVDAKGIAAPGR